MEKYGCIDESIVKWQAYESIAGVLLSLKSMQGQLEFNGDACMDGGLSWHLRGVNCVTCMHGRVNETLSLS